MKGDIIRTKEMRGHDDAEQLGAIKYIRTHAHSDSSELGLRLKTWRALVTYEKSSGWMPSLEAAVIDSGNPRTLPAHRNQYNLLVRIS